MPSPTPSPPAPADLIDAVARVVGDRAGVAAAYLFGSAASGRATPLSDVDVAVLLDDGLNDGRDAGSAREGVLTEITTALARDLGHDAARIDVRDVERLPLAIQGRILTDGRLVVSGDDVRRVRFETRIRQRYFDFLPFLEADTREGLRSLREHYLDG